MADILGAIQSVGGDDNQSKGVDIKSVLNSIPNENSVPSQQKKSQPVDKLEKIEQGFGDVLYGLGRITQHVLPDAALNAVRRSIGFDEVSTKDFDNLVSKRENDYQQAREQAGEKGIDWWRIAGNATNPVNYLGAGSKAAATVLGRIGQGAVQGAGMGAIQGSAESKDPDSFWWDSTKGAVGGAAVGGAISGAIEAISPLVKWGINGIKNLVTKGQTSSTQAAEAVVNDAIKKTGIDPAQNVPLITAYKQEVQSALDHGLAPSETAIVNRARAESLPVPVKLMRWQATGDSNAYSKAMNLRGVEGVGEDVTQRLRDQNAAYIGNLDALGAKNAPDTLTTSQNYAEKIRSFWDQLQENKSKLYDAVKNEKGQSAALDGVSAADQIKAKFDSPQESHIWNQLPSNIRQTIEDIRAGSFPLTVAQAQSLDKQWSRAAMGAPGDVAHALNEARSMLLNAPITESVGQDARMAYQAAKQAHTKQMSLLDPKLPNGFPNPNFQPMIKSLIEDGKPPEQLFDTHFLKSAPSVAKKNMDFLTKLDPDAPQQIGTTLMGEIKRQALNDSSVERGTVSENTLRKWAFNPVMSARLESLMPKPAVDTFKNLAYTVETAKKVPVGAAVSTSNSATPLINFMKNELHGNDLTSIGKNIFGIKGIVQGLKDSKIQSDLQEAMNPGVTLKDAFLTSPTRATINKNISRVTTPSVITTERELSNQKGK